MSGRYIFKFSTKKAGCKGPDSYNGDVVWDESDGPVHLKFWSGKEYVRLSDMVRNEVDKYMKETNRMNERATPETDAEHAQFAMGGFTLDFCRKLERERDEAREKVERQKKEIVRLNGATNHAGGTPLKIALGERDKLNADLEEISSKLVVAMRERDEAIADRDILRINAQREAEHHDRMVGELERVYKERDEAREQLSAAKHFLEKYIAERDEARIAIISTLEKNRHLADGDDCTLAKLKSVVPEWK